jgi:O-acetyl-ADP-ribose deacetylase (regulator of RNase III)
MPCSFVTGDLFQTEGLQAIAHGCNCAGAMGKGIAIDFRRRFPKMYAEYKKRCAEGDFKLGDVFTWTEGGVTVFNLATQETWRTPADIRAVETAVWQMVTVAETVGITRIGLPRIGSGLGGLPWERVRALLDRIGTRTPIDLIVFETYVPGTRPSTGI